MQSTWAQWKASAGVHHTLINPWSTQPTWACLDAQERMQQGVKCSPESTFQLGNFLALCFWETTEVSALISEKIGMKTRVHISHGRPCSCADFPGCYRAVCGCPQGCREVCCMHSWIRLWDTRYLLRASQPAVQRAVSQAARLLSVHWMVW